LLGSPFSLPRMLLGYLILLPAHLSVSYSNDYFDVEVDKFGIPTLFSGGSGILVKYPELRRPAKWIAVGLIVCSLVLGIVFLVIHSYSIWFLGYVLAGNLLGWFYAAPPLRFAYHNLGEVSTALTVGLLVPGMGYLVMRGYLDMEGLLFVIPLILYGFAFILATEIPDEESDRLGNKRTWVACKGREFGFIVVAISLVTATIFLFCYPYLSSWVFPLDFRILGCLSLLPMGVGVVGMVMRPAEKKSATKVVNGIILALAVFLILADGYLIVLAI
jgi:1,4-dihydroxy-2-naphthoate octaprenyltransferase